MRAEILGVERRRRWYDDEKLEIVLSVGVGGTTVTDVARTGCYAPADLQVAARA